MNWLKKFIVSIIIENVKIKIVDGKPELEWKIKKEF